MKAFILQKIAVLLVGGVASNKILRDKMTIMTRLHGARYGDTPPEYAGDNGAMIAYTGLLLYRYGITSKPEETIVRQRWRLDEVDLPWLMNY
jgi:N6-L-threonylcarbamoyladenine synthase